VRLSHAPVFRTTYDAHVPKVSVGPESTASTKAESNALCENSEPHPQSTPVVLDSGPEAAGPVHQSHDWPARVATELLIAFAEATLTRI